MSEKFSFETEDTQNHYVAIHQDYSKNKKLALEWFNSPHSGPECLQIALGSSQWGKDDLLWFMITLVSGPRYGYPISLNDMSHEFTRLCNMVYNSTCETYWKDKDFFDKKKVKNAVYNPRYSLRYAEK